MKPAVEAANDGYSQILWLFGDNDEVTEVGAMNFFVYIINKETQRYRTTEDNIVDIGML